MKCKPRGLMHSQGPAYGCRWPTHTVSGPHSEPWSGHMAQAEGAAGLLDTRNAGGLRLVTTVPDGVAVLGHFGADFGILGHFCGVEIAVHTPGLAPAFVRDDAPGLAAQGPPPDQK